MHKANKKQLDAIQETQKPCLVIAGAGSGKTKVITEKIAYLISVEKYQPESIFALTFTNKAAKEMAHRIKKITPNKDKVWISTFHNLGLTIIRAEAKTLQIKTNFSLFDKADSEKLIKEIVDAKIRDKKEAIKIIANQISSWKNSLIEPETAMEIAQGQQKIVVDIYKKYNQCLRSYNALDFDDLILIPTKLLTQNTEIRHKWNHKIKYLLVDEYQDTNTMQYQLLKALIGIRNKFTLVGDDDQSIYSWRGADPQNMAKLKQDFSNIKVIKLEQNYRSTNNILKVANNLIANNSHVFEKKLFSQISDGEPVKIVETDNEEIEAIRVINEINRHKILQNYNYSDYAILYRSNHQARIVEKTLMSKQIPYIISGDTSFFDRAEIKDIMAYFKLIVNPDDDKSFLRSVNTPKRGIGNATLLKVGETAKLWNKSLFDTCCDDRFKYVLEEKAYSRIENFIKMIVDIQDKFKRADPVASIELLKNTIKYDQHLLNINQNIKKTQMSQKNVQELFDWIKKMVSPTNVNAISLTEAITKIMLKSMLDNNEEQNCNKLNLMTLHATKGLEFNNVYIIGMEEGILPHQNSIDSQQIQEERRLAYVGITRAKRNLTISYCKERTRFQKHYKASPSRFLNELPQNNIEWNAKQKIQTEAQKHQSARMHIAKLRESMRKN